MVYDDEVREDFVWLYKFSQFSSVLRGKTIKKEKVICGIKPNQLTKPNKLNTIIQSPMNFVRQNCIFVTRFFLIIEEFQKVTSFNMEWSTKSLHLQLYYLNEFNKLRQ